MSEGVAAPPGAAAAAEEGAAAGAGGPAEGDGGPDPAAREVRCSDCIVWNRQQTWLCVVPLFIGFVGLGLSLMLLKWIVVGSVKEYVPTELMDSKGIEQDPFFLSKQPTTPPKSVDATSAGAAAATTTSRTPNRISTRLTTMTKAPTRFPGTRGPIRAGPPRSTTARHTAVPPTVLATATAVPFSTTVLISRPAPGTPGTQPLPLWPTAAYTTSSYKTYLQDSAPSWTLSPFQEASTTTPDANASPKHRK
ncbi:Pro-neuregulin-3, membrane-bound isoform [Varanus komodoensis]|nr:Pro-neuregulin-3, membrane-bound isoform [Varanus komodoensis]